MGCKKPMIRIEDTWRYETAADGHKYHPAYIQKRTTPGELEKTRLKKVNYLDGTRYKTEIIPCGKCIGCRLEYSRQWANRGYLEAKLWENNYFLTLTYEDGYLPENDSLNGDDFTQFMKTFRSHMSDNHIQTDGIRFMGCGEYGSEGDRPHYHIILFNCNLPTSSFYKPRIINHEFYYQNEIIEKCWEKGIINISEANWNTIAYTARYITKKIYGEDAEEYYGDKKPEFMRCSNRPGIAKGYYDLHKEEIYEKDQILIRNKNGVIITKPPIYFDKLYEKENPEKMKKIKRKRIIEGYEQQQIKDEQTSLTRLEQMAIEERTIADRSKKLLRGLEKKQTE